jgi:ribose-phosphate pyrophosphokinase
MSFELKIFSGTANIPLAKQVAKALRMEMGQISITKFADQEIGCQVMENVRGCDCFVIQPASPPNCNDNRK